MKSIIVLIAVVALVRAAPGGLSEDQKPSFTSGRIVGGIDALPNEFPSVVSLRRAILTLSQHICGGTILDNFWVMTAAHCITQNPADARFVIWAGTHNFNAAEATRQVVDVLRSVVHPEYLGGVNPSDVALLRLATPLTFTPAVQAVHLPEENSDPRLGPVTLAGWGSTSGATQIMPAILQKVVKPLIDWNDCETANGGPGASPLGPTNVCTGPLTGGISACSGDSGSPILIIEGDQQMQVGIASWIWIPCGSIGRPSVYVGVSHYLGWVREQIAQG